VDGETLITLVVMVATNLGILTWIGNRIVDKLDRLEQHLYELKVELARRNR